MNTLQIIAGSLLIVSGLLIILLVMLQKERGQGLSGAIGGGADAMLSNRSRSNEALLAKITKILAIVFFVIALVVSLVGLLVK